MHHEIAAWRRPMYATEIAARSGSRVFTGGLMLAGAVDAMADSVRIRRAEAASSVQELAIRLQESRADETAALNVAMALQASSRGRAGDLPAPVAGRCRTSGFARRRRPRSRSCMRCAPPADR